MHKKSMQSNSPPVKKQLRWTILKPWFQAHSIGKLDDSFVVTVKFAQQMRIFVTGTSKGEVKLWSSGIECECLGFINDPLNPWDH